MSEYGDTLTEDGLEGQFESERRGYNRRQVDEHIAWRNNQVRELENRLAQSLTQAEHLRSELSEARQAATRAPHEEISERVGQILKLAADEAKANRERTEAETAQVRETAKAETDQLRAEAKAETDQLRAEAQSHAEQLLVAAKEQAEQTITASVAQAEHLTAAAKAEADRTVGEANQHAENTVTAAIAHAKQQLDEATSRAAAVHDGAERRLNLLISRHTETVRRLTEIRDVVTTLVAGEAARGSLEDEVNRTLGITTGNGSATSEGRPTVRPESAPSGQRLEPRPETRIESRAGGAPEGVRPPIPEAAEPLEELPAPPGPIRQARSMAGHSAIQGGPRERAERPDPLGGGRPARHGAEDLLHAGDPVRHPADEGRHQADVLRQSSGGIGRTRLSEDREFDDTPVHGLDVED